MEGFTVTSVDGQAVPEAAPQEQVQEAPVNETPQEDATEVQEQGQEQTQENFSLETEAEVSQQEIDEALETPTIDYGSESFELDPVKAEDPLPVETPAAAAPDLLSFVNENKDLIAEFQTLNQNFDEFDPKDLVAHHLSSTYPELSGEDINILMEDYTYDEDADPAEIVRKKIAFQKAVSEAKVSLNQRKDQLTQELASRNLGGPTQADLQAQQAQQAAIEAFQTQTKSYFTQNFEGFEFNVGDNQGLRVKVNNAESVMQQQSDINNIIGKYFDADTGVLTDPKGYHTAMAIASNPDKFMEFAYQKGKADQASQTAKESKNIDMTGRNAGTEHKKQTQWKIVD